MNKDEHISCLQKVKMYLKEKFSKKVIKEELDEIKPDAPEIMRKKLFVVFKAKEQASLSSHTKLQEQGS